MSEELFTILQAPIEQVGLSITPAQEVAVAFDTGGAHRFSIPLTIVVT